MEKECEKCKKMIDLSKDIFVNLGTYEGDKTINETYFHMTCWIKYFEEKARDKAMAVVNGMQERMKPIAEQMIKKLQGAIDKKSGGDKVVNF